MSEIELILAKLKIVSEVEENGAYICDKEHSKILLDEIERLEEELDKTRLSELNKEYIINELEKYINQKIEQCYNEGSTVGEFYKICDIDEKLHELKGEKE